jgi:hypothetical protein
MFAKYASNILKSISNDCLLKSFACKNEDDSQMYASISSRIEWLINRLGVEKDSIESSTPNNG